jgi:hypothetical protein
MANKVEPQLVVAGTCGLAISVPINGVDVRFVCSQAGEDEPKPHRQPPIIVAPIDTGGGHIAELRFDPTGWLEPKHFLDAAQESSNEPHVVSVTAGEPLDTEDLRNQVIAARDEGRRVVLEVRPHGG